VKYNTAHYEKAKVQKRETRQQRMATEKAIQVKRATGVCATPTPIDESEISGPSLTEQIHEGIKEAKAGIARERERVKARLAKIEARLDGIEETLDSVKKGLRKHEARRAEEKEMG
jgi:hypothetical protein